MSLPFFRLVSLAVLVCAAAGVLAGTISAQNIEMEMRDRDSGARIPLRLKFIRGEKQSGLPRNLLKSGKWVLVEESVPIAPKPGEYEFLAQRGHEFTDIKGGFSVEKGAADVVTVEVPRSTSMREEGWYSGDHFSNLPVGQLQRWQAAEAVDMVVVRPEKSSDVENEKGKPQSQSKRRRKVDDEAESVVAGENEVGAMLSTQSSRWRSTGGSLLFHRASENSRIATSDELSLPQVISVLSEYENMKDFVPEVEELWARDIPILLSTNRIKAAQILNSANGPEGDAKLDFRTKAGQSSLPQLIGKPGTKGSGSDVFVPIPEEDRIRYRDGRGVGLLAERIFWSILETGLRITPTASSGFGEGESYLGYNRTYVHCDESVNETLYWQSVSLGKTMVTNGPLLRVTVNNQHPGATFASRAGEPIELDISASLSVRDPVEYLDVIFNGETIYSAKLEDHYRKGEFPPLSIDKSGWLVIRVVTSHDRFYRLATTAPFYFEFDGQSRISKKAVEFMTDWLNRSSDAIMRESKVNSDMRSILDDAEKFWLERIEQANAP